MKMCFGLPPLVPLLPHPSFTSPTPPGALELRGGPRRRASLPGLSSVLILSLAMVGCGGENLSDIQTLTRDSAGVTIVESSDAPSRGEGGWVLDQAPSLTIGTFQGDTLYELYRVSGGTRLSDGRIVISDNGSFQLRMFGPNGEFLGSWGREGEGPGEFQSVQVMGVLGGDTLVVLDGRLRRISLFEPGAGFLSQGTFTEEVGLTFVPNGMFQDGSVVFGGGLSFGPGSDMPTDGLQRPDTPFRSADLDGSLVTEFGAIPGSEYFMRTRGGGGEFMISASLIPFGKRPAAFARGDRLYLGSADEYEIQAFDPDGRLTRILRVSRPLTPVTSADVERLIEEAVTELEDPSRAPEVRSSYGEMPVPDFMPAYRGFHVDSEGCLWVEEYPLPGSSLRSWTVFDPDGSPLSTLSLPSDNRLLEIGEDFVMTVFQDPLGVEYLRIYALTRGE